MQKLSLCLVLCSAVATSSNVATADEPATPIEDRGGYQLSRTHDLLIQSQAGRDYRLLVAVPDALEPEHGFPVLYVLDANAVFGTAVEAQRLQSRRQEKTGVPPMLIVGIGYPGDRPFDVERRTYDLTPPAEASKLPPRPDGSAWLPHGGADEFLRFIEDEVKPVVESRFKVDRRHQAIFGHSFGGLFVLHTLMTRPAAFQSYVAASPSVWWNDYALLEKERTFGERLAKTDVPVRLLVITGELEKGGGPTAALLPTESSKAFGGTADMAGRLAQSADAGITVEFQEMPGENHGSVLPVALNRGLRFVTPAHRAEVGSGE